MFTQKTLSCMGSGVNTRFTWYRFGIGVSIVVPCVVCFLWQGRGMNIGQPPCGCCEVLNGNALRNAIRSCKYFVFFQTDV